MGQDHAERLYVLPHIERYMGPYGLWVGQAPDGSWMFVRGSQHARGVQPQPEVIQMSLLTWFVEGKGAARKVARTGVLVCLFADALSMPLIAQSEQAGARKVITRVEPKCPPTLDQLRAQRRVWASQSKTAFTAGIITAGSWNICE